MIDLGNGILASHEAELFKVVVVLFFLILWGIKAVVDLAIGTKKKPTMQAPPPLPPVRRQVPLVPPMVPRNAPRVNAPRPIATIPTNAAQAPAVNQALSARPAPLPPISSLAKAPPKRKSKTAKPALPPQNAAQLSAIVGAVASSPRPAVAPPPITRSAVASWINVRTLRSQFLLAEALRPPVALREPR